MTINSGTSAIQMSKIKRVRATMLLPALMVVVASCSQGESQMTEEAPTTVQLSEADLATATMSVVNSGVVLNGSLQPALIVRVNAQAPGNIMNIRVDRGVRV